MNRLRQKTIFDLGFVYSIFISTKNKKENKKLKTKKLFSRNENDNKPLPSPVRFRRFGIMYQPNHEDELLLPTANDARNIASIIDSWSRMAATIRQPVLLDLGCAWLIVQIMSCMKCLKYNARHWHLFKMCKKSLNILRLRAIIRKGMLAVRMLSYEDEID